MTADNDVRQAADKLLMAIPPDGAIDMDKKDITHPGTGDKISRFQAILEWWVLNAIAKAKESKQ